jgi:putative endonuclease
MNEPPYWAYVLWSASCHRFYIGISEDPEERPRGHNAGMSKWTKNKGSWIIVWRRQCSSLSEARKLENHFKRQKGSAGFYEFTRLTLDNFPSSGS